VGGGGRREIKCRRTLAGKIQKVCSFCKNLSKLVKSKKATGRPTQNLTKKARPTK
jgi:hypothetical protein